MSRTEAIGTILDYYPVIEEGDDISAALKAASDEAVIALAALLLTQDEWTDGPQDTDALARAWAAIGVDDDNDEGVGLTSEQLERWARTGECEDVLR